ncbi:50S ribosomal protein L19e [Candidatus Micrarchaeota archaeon]|nr:50S ribosomal protein L19e [Candidatus Micrarchaeota archaeon]
MSLKTVKRVACRIFGCGESRVVIADAKKASEALSADDVRELFKSGAMRISPVIGVGRGKARKNKNARHAGRGRGVGSRRGSPNAVLSLKTRWIAKVRSLRAALRASKHSLANKDYAKLYRMVKGNAFASRRQLREHINAMASSASAGAAEARQKGAKKA